MLKLTHLRPTRAQSTVAAAIAVFALVATACSNSSPTSAGSSTPTSANDSSSSSAPAAAASSSSAPVVPVKQVHIKLLNGDGSEYGVGMPVIAFFSKRITSGKALQDATTVTVDGKPASGAWYFETSDAGNGPIEGHFRLQNYWPAHAKVHVDIPAKGLSAGKGLAYDDSLTLDFTTGPKNIAIVNDATHKMTVTSDGKPYGTFPVSLGASSTPTFSGTKVIMEQDKTVCMHDTDNTYYECGIKWDQRLTYSGEYLHAAPWNVRNIDNGVNSSNGCTNLLPSDAEKLYHFLRVGDVVQYPNADGPAMQLGSGYGDWNVDWAQWQTGGLVSTTA